MEVAEIFIDDKICVKCCACVSESEFGGVKFKDGKIFIDESKCEDWAEIISICPTGAIKFRKNLFNFIKTCR